MPRKEIEAPAEGYLTLLAELKERIVSARIKAALAVNRGLIALYWSIGADMCEGSVSRDGALASLSGWPLI